MILVMYRQCKCFMWVPHEIISDGWFHSLLTSFCLLPVSGVHMALKQNCEGGFIAGEFQSLLLTLGIDEGGMSQKSF